MNEAPLPTAPANGDWRMSIPIEPARKARAEIFALERKLSDLVNAAYGLTPGEVQLMWDTAPPRACPEVRGFHPRLGRQVQWPP